MDKNQALQVFNGQIPQTGEVDYADVENTLRASSEGRAALRFFHNLRRSGAIKARVIRENGGMMISRPGGA